MYNGSRRWGDQGKERRRSDSQSSSDSELDWNGYFSRGRTQARSPEVKDDPRSINSDFVLKREKDDETKKKAAFNRLFAAVSRPRSDSLLSSTTRSQISESDDDDVGVLPNAASITNNYQDVGYLATRIKAILLAYITFTRRNLHTQKQKNILMGMYTALNLLIAALQKDSRSELTPLPVYINNVVAIIKTDLLTDLRTWGNDFASGMAIDPDDCVAYLRLRYMILATVKLLILASDGEDLQKLQRDISILGIPEAVNKLTKNTTIKTVFFNEDEVNKNLAAIYPEDVEYRNKSETFLFGFIYENLMKIFILITSFANVSANCNGFYTSLNVLLDEFVANVEACINAANAAETNVWILSARLFDSIKSIVKSFLDNTALRIDYIMNSPETDFNQPFSRQPCFQDREVILKFLDQFAEFLNNLSGINFFIADIDNARTFKANIIRQRLFYSTYQNDPMTQEMDKNLIRYLSRYRNTLPKNSAERKEIDKFIVKTPHRESDAEHGSYMCGHCCCSIL